MAGVPLRARAVEPDFPTLEHDRLPGRQRSRRRHPPRPARGPADPAAPRGNPNHRAGPGVSGPPATLVPEDHRAAWTALWATHAAGDLPTAVVLAHRLEAQLEAEYGPSHPDTITVLSARAWLTLIQRADPRGTVELLLTTAIRRQAARARPELETARAARNAHAVWRILCDQDPEGAREMAERPRRWS